MGSASPAGFDAAESDIIYKFKYEETIKSVYVTQERIGM